MKKLVFIFCCVPIIGFGQLKQENTFHIYLDLFNIPQILGKNSAIQDTNFHNKKIAIGSFGFEGSKSFLSNHRLNLNYGMDYFQYKLLDKTIIQNLALTNTTPFGKGGYRYTYLRFKGGLGVRILSTKNSAYTFNIDALGYFNHKGEIDDNVSFTTYAIDLNFKTNFFAPLHVGNYQFKIGYYLVQPQLSSNLITEGESGDHRTQLNQDYIALERVYVSLKLFF